MIARLATILVLTTRVLAAEAKPPAAPPSPPAELKAQMEHIVGKLTCDGKVLPSPYDPGHPSKATVLTEPVLSGFWYVHHVVEEKTKESPNPYEALGYFTWDAAAKGLVLTWHDNMGGRSLETSPGWQGDKLVLTGEMVMMGRTTKVRDTLVKKGTGVLHTSEMQDDKGAWIKLGEDDCTK